MSDSTAPRPDASLPTMVVDAWLIEEASRVAHPLPDGITTIGRDPRNAVLVHDATISRWHAEVRAASATWTLRVMGTTGADVNGSRVADVLRLASGDLIDFGTRRFRFHRGALPAGVRRYEGHDGTGDPALLAQTTTMPAIASTTDERPAVPSRPAVAGPRRGALVGVALAVAAALVALLTQLL
jgi:pSer/pThr/pTyr-binding forkhead associated (FHA) protein